MICLCVQQVIGVLCGKKDNMVHAICATNCDKDYQGVNGILSISYHSWNYEYDMLELNSHDKS